jgi:putative transposase
MPIRKRLEIEGLALAFVTTGVDNFVPAVQERPVAEVIARQLGESAEHFRTSIVGYVLMPTHIHALLGLREISELSHLMQSFKILSSKNLKKLKVVQECPSFWQGRKFRFWEQRFDDLIITSEEQFRIKLNYIHNNPVKAGLVREPADWYFSSAGDWLLNRQGPLKVDKDFTWLK